MVSRRRNYSEAEAAPAQQQPTEKKKGKDEKKGKEEPGLLHRLRNCWEFANLMQYISMFGKVMKIDEDFGIEVSVLLSTTWMEALEMTDGFFFFFFMNGRTWKMNASSLRRRRNSWKSVYVF